MPKKKLDTQTLKRLFGYVFRNYKLKFAIVMILVVLSSLTNVASSLFMYIWLGYYLRICIIDLCQEYHKER